MLGVAPYLPLEIHDGASPGITTTLAIRSSSSVKRTAKSRSYATSPVARQRAVSCVLANYVALSLLELGLRLFQGELVVPDRLLQHLPARRDATKGAARRHGSEPRVEDRSVLPACRSSRWQHDEARNDDPSEMDAQAGEMKRQLDDAQSGKLLEGAPPEVQTLMETVKRFVQAVDREKGTGVGLAYCRTEDDLRRADER